jgi:cytochrome c oxidase cbb3-type subunit 1
MMVGGTLRGLSWMQSAPFIDSVSLMAPYWTARALGGGLMFASHLVFAYNVWRMRP